MQDKPHKNQKEKRLVSRTAQKNDAFTDVVLPQINAESVLFEQIGNCHPHCQQKNKQLFTRPYQKRKSKQKSDFMPEKAFLAATGPDRKNNGANLTDDGKYPKVIFKYPPDHFFNFHNVKILF